MQSWSPDGVRQERTGWRDESISARHRLWGFNCPAVDLDFLLVEFNVGLPVALIEYKADAAAVPNLLHPTYRALCALADGYNQGPLPFMIVRYDPVYWAVKVCPVNDAARKHFTEDETLCEHDYVRKLYYLRRLVLTQHIEGSLSTIIPFGW